MLGNVVCTVFTWLRSCSTDLTPDLLTDPEPSPATRTTAAHTQPHALILKETLFLTTVTMTCVFYFEGDSLTSVFSQQSFS